MKRLSGFLLTVLAYMSVQVYAAEKAVKVGMCTDLGGINDQSFNQSAWEGLKRTKKELDVKVMYQESKQDADYDPNLETLLEANNDLIWGIGFKMADAVLKAAKENPKQKYGIIDFSFGDKTPSNVLGILFRAEEGAFLAGYIAAKTSLTGKVGFIGGMDVPIIQAFQFGYKSGAKFANRKIEVMDQFSSSFSDAAKGKAIALQMISKNIDVLFHAAGAVGDGVIEAVKEKNKFAVGVDRDQNYLAPKNVITSSMKRVDQAIFDVVKDLKNNKFQGGQTLFLGLKEGAVDISPTTAQLVKPEILEQVKKIKQDIIDGKIKPPNSKDTYSVWEKTLK
jgi:basic membrane protein A